MNYEYQETSVSLPRFALQFVITSSTYETRSSHGLNHPYIRKWSIRKAGGEISRANCISRTYVSTFFGLIRGNGGSKKISLVFAGR